MSTTSGLLGTSAPLRADVSLLLGLAVAMLLTAGAVLARRRRYEAHRRVQSIAVSLNVAHVATLMIGSFQKSVAPGVPERLGDPYHWAASLHAAVGAIALLFGVFVALRGNGLVPPALRFRRYKPYMRAAYVLYMAATVLGVGVYAVWYGGAPTERLPAATSPDAAAVVLAAFQFAPRELEVAVGTMVTWTHQDGAPHTVTADDGKAFRSGELARGGTYRHRFLTAGVVAYYCELHGEPGGKGMAGRIRVVPR